MHTIVDLDIKNIPLTEFMKALGQEHAQVAQPTAICAFTMLHMTTITPRLWS